MFSKQEIIDLGCNQLNEQEVDTALDAFNGFAEMFDSKWVLDYFRGGASRSTIFVKDISRLWDAWKRVGQLEKSEKIVSRWRNGFESQGVNFEIQLVDKLLDQGLEVELFPELEDSTKVPDCRFKIPDQTKWSYMEMSQRKNAQSQRTVMKCLNILAHAAADAAPGSHGMVAVLRAPSEVEVEEICRWLRNKPKDQATFEDLAVFCIKGFEEGVGESGYFEGLVPGPRLYGTNLRLHENRKGTAKLPDEDALAVKVLKTEASQLPSGESGVVALDLTSVTGGVKEWEEMIKKHATKHTRVAAVLLWSEARAVYNFGIKGRLLINPHAACPLSTDVREKLDSIVRGTARI